MSDEIGTLWDFLDALTKDERSVFVYAESCIVDHGGLLEGVRMNADDHAALNKFADMGLLSWGRIPGRMLGKAPGIKWEPTHWVRFTPQAWLIAHGLRERRALQLGPFATEVFAEIDERAMA